MKQVLIHRGEVRVEDVPAPMVERGSVLVRVERSCISAGTELSGVTASGTPLWKRALKEPEKVKKAARMAATEGLSRTRSLVEGKLLSGRPAGYSAAGTVLEVGEGVDDLRPGDRVACAGAQCAFHAEVIRVPRNLTVPVPDGLDAETASTVTLGAIALQGVRRAQPTLGETFVVIGLGILGQLTAQTLRANGCRVIGTDLDRDRIRLARELGMDAGIHPDDGVDVDQVARLTGGVGADGVIITASSPSSKVVSTAFRMCRRKGRVVLVGDVGLNLNRADFYEKELDFLISTSYGPGRYDRTYEEEGLDYPIAYVRWTENRNMAEYLRLLAEGKVRVRPLISAVHPIDEAPAAYEALRREAAKPLTVLLSYPQPQAGEAVVRVVPNPSARPAGTGQVRIGVIGAGEFARAMHLPNLRALSDRYHLRAVASRTGHNAAAVARQFGADCATTDYREVLADPDTHAVLIATRHHLHASMALEALLAGKHVLVEKPLALTEEDVAAIEALYESGSPSGGMPILVTGFNRRFSPYARRVRELVDGRTNPMILNYRMNAGHVPPDHWVHTEEGGGRNLGEACHVYDLFMYLTGSTVTDVQARSVGPTTDHYRRRDNFVAIVAFADGSLGTLTYTALGHQDYPKERLDVFVDGAVLTLDDYRRLTVTGRNVKGFETRGPEKGHKEMLEAFAQAIQQGGDWPIPLWQQVEATRTALRVERLLGGTQSESHARSP